MFHTWSIGSGTRSIQYSSLPVIATPMTPPIPLMQIRKAFQMKNDTKRLNGDPFNSRSLYGEGTLGLKRHASLCAFGFSKTAACLRLDQLEVKPFTLRTLSTYFSGKSMSMDGCKSATTDGNRCDVSNGFLVLYIVRVWSSSENATTHGHGMTWPTNSCLYE